MVMARPLDQYGETVTDPVTKPPAEAVDGTWRLIVWSRTARVFGPEVQAGYR
jgi:hypothetical protein